MRRVFYLKREKATVSLCESCKWMLFCRAFIQFAFISGQHTCHNLVDVHFDYGNIYLLFDLVIFCYLFICEFRGKGAGFYRMYVNEKDI